MNFKQVTSKLFSYFVRGLLLLAPVYLTGSILFSIVDKLDQQFYFHIRGTGILSLFLIVVLVGFVGTTFIAIPAFKLFEAWMERLPLVRLIYFSLKDLINAFVGDKKKFDRPVIMVLNKENGIHKLGFITQDNLKSLEIEDELITVYCPHSYAFSGETFLVPSQNVTLINASTAEVMKFVVSGGVSTK
jgi:uncharacterized membrane protein